MTDTPARAIVLGGYGLIGSACMRALAAEGYAVTGVGRSEWAARRVVPDADWVIRDIARVEEADWRQILAGADVVVNASGAFQESGRDDLTGIHIAAVRRIVAALEGTNTRLVHISSAGVAPDAPAAFFTTKAEGDAAIMASRLDWVILRPTLVIGPAAYGATGLLRAAAAMPWIAVDVLPDAYIQSVYIGDVAHAVVEAARGDIPAGTLAHVTEDEGRSIRDTIDALRRWLGFAEPRIRMTLPRPLLSVVSGAADLLGRLGWRSPLRSTAIRGLEANVHGDASVWRAAGGRDCRSLAESLASMPATVQERWFARLYLLLPLGVGILSLVWVLTGALALARFDTAAAVLTGRGVADWLAGLAVAGGAAVDIALGLAILWRPWTRLACLAMVGVSLAYLVGGTILAPDLWADPLGPFLKILPGIGLALATHVLAGDR